MLAQAHHPNHLNPSELDEYLKQGWFRMGQAIFHTNFLNFKDQYFSAIWLRINLATIVTDKQELKLCKRNQDFRIEFQSARITKEKEVLFSKYKQGIDFQASASLQSLLYGASTENIFNTLEINIYDGNQLIASGFFDIGRNSAAGITSFYDPHYKKYSLGKYLIYSKINYCKNLGLRYFYPGYFVPGYHSFDYKLEIHTSSLQYLQLSTQQWLPVQNFSSQVNPLEVMKMKLATLHPLMEGSGIQSSIMKYEYFDANLVPDLNGFELFDFPVFIYCSALSNNMLHVIVVYDVRDDLYHLMQCRSVWTSNLSDSNGVYNSHLLKAELDLFASDSMQQMIDVLLTQLNSKDDFLYRKTF